MRINNNLSAMNTQRIGSLAVKAQANSIEKLSSGLRINKAADDAAGLSISEKMRGQIRGLKQASRNTQDAISMIQTAEGAASGVHDMLQRMRELAVQSANGTLTESDREKIDIEVKQLVKQVDFTANTTEFNTIKLLNSQNASAFAGISQAGLDSLTAKLPGWINDGLVSIRDQLGVVLPDSPINRPMSVSYYYDSGTSTGASMGTTDGGATLTLSVNLYAFFDGSGNLKQEGVLDTLIAHEVVHALEFSEMPYALTGGGEANENWFTEGLAMTIQGGNFFGVTDHNVNLVDPFDGDYRSAYEAVKVLHEITNGGISAFIDQLEAGDTLDQAFANTVQDVTGTELSAATGLGVINSVAGFIGWYNNNAANGVLGYLTGSADFDNSFSGAITSGNVKGSTSALTLDQTILNGTGTSELSTHYSLSFDNAGGGAADFYYQIGANSGQFTVMSKANLTAKGLGIDQVDYTTIQGSQSAIGAVDAAIAVVSQIRSGYGVMQNRLEHTMKNLDNAEENIQSSESRIRDLDIAKEMMKFTTQNILTSSYQAMLSQANQVPQGILQLLR